MKKYDALIIGFGKGGKTLAAALGKKGIKTAVIEKSPLMYGGTCINIGCIPTKKLIHTAADAKKNQQADYSCLLYTSPSPRDGLPARMPSSA